MNIISFIGEMKVETWKYSSYTCTGLKQVVFCYLYLKNSK